MSSLDDILGIFKKAAAGEVMRLAAQQAEKELSDLRAANKALTERLNDWSEQYYKIIGDGGCPDEVHCACVPALREEISRREKIEQERADLVRKAVGTTSLEHLVVRHNESVALLDEAHELLGEIVPYLNRQAMLADDGDALDLRKPILALVEKMKPIIHTIRIDLTVEEFSEFNKNYISEIMAQARKANKAGKETKR